MLYQLKGAFSHRKNTHVFEYMSLFSYVQLQSPREKPMESNRKIEGNSQKERNKWLLIVLK